MIEWIKANDELPVDGDRVLIFLNGNFYMATYQREHKNFEVKEIAGIIDNLNEIYWAELTEPEN